MLMSILISCIKMLEANLFIQTESLGLILIGFRVGLINNSGYETIEKTYLTTFLQL